MARETITIETLEAFSDFMTTRKEMTNALYSLARLELSSSGMASAVSRSMANWGPISTLMSEVFANGESILNMCNAKTNPALKALKADPASWQAHQINVKTKIAEYFGELLAKIDSISFEMLENLPKATRKAKGKVPATVAIEGTSYSISDLFSQPVFVLSLRTAESYTSFCESHGVSDDAKLAIWEHLADVAKFVRTRKRYTLDELKANLAQGTNTDGKPLDDASRATLVARISKLESKQP